MTLHSRIVFAVICIGLIFACTAPPIDTPVASTTISATPEVVMMTPTSLPPTAPSALPDTPVPALEATSQPVDTLPPPTPARLVSSSTPTPAIGIDYFEIVSDEPLHPGRRIKMRWSAHGASAQIIAGTRQRFIEWWVVPLSGEMTVELTNTLFRNPGLGLRVSDGADVANWVDAVIPLEWECDYRYFFEPEPARCPRDAAITIHAAEQRFEGGRMLWLESENSIIVL